MPTAFTPPGPGAWELDRSHFPGGTTPIMQELLPDAIGDAYAKAWPESGIPAETLSVRFVNGFFYSRLRPLIGADKPPSKPPPSWVMWLGSRLHPEFRRRAKAARKTLTEPETAAAIAEWHDEIRPRLVARNLELGSVDLAALDDEELAAHVDGLVAYLRETFEEHFRLHNHDLGPIALLIYNGKEWGIPAVDLVPALAGASPSTAAPLEALARIRSGLADAGVVPRSLDDIRASSPELAGLLDDYLARHGAVLFAGYDLDSPTLIEAPDVILSTILTDTGERRVDETALEAQTDALRNRVPDAERTRFDELLADARDAMDLRDDNGPITAEWPCGLLRLSLLEAGRRAATAGRLDAADHIFELESGELGALIRGDAGHVDAPTAAARAEERAACKLLDPPLTLGDPEPPPPLDALPEPLRILTQVVMTAIAELGMGSVDAAAGPAEDGVLSGVGVGSRVVTGVACVAENADEAFDNLDGPQLLVTRTTSPAYNMVLGLVGGLVTAEGGPMCHAAVLSRELDISAVVGARGALETIAHGDTIEIDPDAGTVRVVSRAR